MHAQEQTYLTFIFELMANTRPLGKRLMPYRTVWPVSDILRGTLAGDTILGPAPRHLHGADKREFVILKGAGNAVRLNS